MNGASATTATTTSFIRLYRAVVTTAGTAGANNVGNITVRDSGAGTDRLLMLAGVGQTQTTFYALATGVSAALTSIHCYIDSTKEIDLRLFTAGPIDETDHAKSMKQEMVGMTGSFSYRPLIPHLFAGPCDIWFEAQGSVSASVNIDYELALF